MNKPSYLLLKHLTAHQLLKLLRVTGFSEGGDIQSLHITNHDAISFSGNYDPQLGWAFEFEDNGYNRVTYNDVMDFYTGELNHD